MFISFLTTRLFKALMVMLGVVVINFFLIRMAPGDPAAVLAGESGASDPAFVEALRAQFGLDQPLLTQLWVYLKGAVQLDLGYSYRNHVPVFDLIMERLPATLLLMAAAFVISIVAGVALGALAARSRFRNRHRWVDSLVMSSAMLLYATPLFWLALLSVIIFSVILGWFPAFGMESVAASYVGWEKVLDIGRHLVLPACSLAAFFMAVYARLIRASMLEVMGMDYVKTARAKGVPPGRVLRVHVMRNALMPVVTFAGVQLGQLAGGAVLTETVFGWPGVGRLMFDALLQRDYQLLLGGFLVTSAMVVFFNFMADLVYRVLDPRIGANGAKS
ncbi:ABC transporter permease [Kerstersia gyiorum]|jgi:peptide/nickel transport system permease protein|uniref:ABC transporter permease n=1 Tax=Kerstersia gyiorum TaxID=206506 RepID=A0A171KN75_9BURK|nr:ABC transporter permease [Kerstersia gyiorum]AZV95084.1 ABC transporter permease [Bordetella sp. J329]MCO7641826.1 ABC transporter permease [Pseudomonas sp. S 311-6]KKO70342.1 ABC transporter permease [Kerstersia gyiorum]MCH4270435.1 ABC transporter permease [Kerstersia gyiorum]MCI1230090.1 ABC transporter permease [Kerstersia gyiorum]